MKNKKIASNNSSYYYTLGMINILNELGLFGSGEYKSIVILVKKHYGFDI